MGRAVFELCFTSHEQDGIKMKSQDCQSMTVELFSKHANISYPSLLQPTTLQSYPIHIPSLALTLNTNLALAPCSHSRRQGR